MVWPAAGSAAMVTPKLPADKRRPELNVRSLHGAGRAAVVPRRGSATGLSTSYWN